MEKSKGGMPRFNAEHWEKKMGNVNVSDGRYSSEMNQAEDYKASVDKLSAYVKSHKAEH
jgi:hypothetical protein